MTNSSFLESYGVKNVPKKDVLEVLKRGQKVEKVSPVPDSSYRPWKWQFEWNSTVKEESLETTPSNTPQIQFSPLGQQLNW